MGFMNKRVHVEMCSVRIGRAFTEMKQPSIFKEAHTIYFVVLVKSRRSLRYK